MNPRHADSARGAIWRDRLCQDVQGAQVCVKETTGGLRQDVTEDVAGRPAHRLSEVCVDLRGGRRELRGKRLLGDRKPRALLQSVSLKAKP